MNIQVFDNFLPDDEFAKLTSLVLGDYFPWYFNYSVNGPGEPHNHSAPSFQFTHTFVRQGHIVSDFYPWLFPLLERIDVSEIYRAKVNLNTHFRTNTPYGFHKDIQGVPSAKTAIFYLLDSDGDTVFVTGERVTPVANRLVIFNADLEHTGETSVISERRVVFSVIYE